MNERPQVAAETPTPPLAVAAEGAASLLDISRSQFFKLHASGKIPAPVYLGTKAPRWRVAELSDWLDSGCPDRQTWDRMRAAKEKGRTSP